MSTYTDADIAHAIAALASAAVDHDDAWIGGYMPDIVSAVLDAVAPAIAARALREAAVDGPLHFAATHTSRDARGWNVAEAEWLRDRADEIERTSPCRRS